MKKIVAVLIIGILFSAVLYAEKSKVDKISEVALNNIFYVNHDCFRIEYKGKVIYTDPLNLPDNSKKADIILITHQHQDHLQLESINKISDAKTVIYAPITAEYEIKEKTAAKIKRVKPGDSITVSGISLEVTAAYNLKPERIGFHPKKEGFTGYLITINGVKIYFAGDTDKIPEMKKIKCDIALLPVSGTYVMDADEAAEAAALLNPKIVIPMHYGVIVGSENDAVKLKELLENKKIKTVIKDREVK